MARADFPVLTAEILVEEFKSIYREVLTESVSDLPLAPLIIESSFFAIRNPLDQELFFATSNYLDEFLTSAIPPTVRFDQSRLIFWARDALEFASQNVRHSSFIQIFSTSLQYDTAIQALLQIDSTGNFMKEYFQQLRIDSAYISESLPTNFLAALIKPASASIQPSLASLAHFLVDADNRRALRSNKKVKTVKEIRTSSSFMNKKGAIPFSEYGGRFRIQQSSEIDRIAQYRPVVDRAIRRLVDAKTFQRIDNRDRVLAGLLEEYHDEVRRPTKDIRIPIMWTCGLEIEARIRRQASVVDMDEKLDEEDLFDLRRLLVSHTLFLNCFGQSASLLKDVESSAAIYQRIDDDTKRLSPLILRRISQDTDLVEEETAAAIARAVPTTKDDVGLESKGQVALRLGLLRGLLQAAGGHLLTGVEKAAEKATVDVTSRFLLETLRADPTFAAALAFLRHEASALIQLSDQIPVYFAYIKHLLEMFGL